MLPTISSNTRRNEDERSCVSNMSHRSARSVSSLEALRIRKDMDTDATSICSTATHDALLRRRGAQHMRNRNERLSYSPQQTEVVAMASRVSGEQRTVFIPAHVVVKMDVDPVPQEASRDFYKMRGGSMTKTYVPNYGIVPCGRGKFFLDIRLSVTAPFRDSHERLRLADESEVPTLPLWWQYASQPVALENFVSKTSMDDERTMGVQSNASAGSHTSCASSTSTHSVGVRSRSHVSGSTDTNQHAQVYNTKQNLLDKVPLWKMWEYWCDTRTLSYLGFVASIVLARFNLLSKDKAPEIYYFTSEYAYYVGTEFILEDNLVYADLRLLLVWQNVVVDHPQQSYMLREAIAHEFSSHFLNSYDKTQPLQNMFWRHAIQQHTFTGVEAIPLVGTTGDDLCYWMPCHFCQPKRIMRTKSTLKKTSNTSQSTHQQQQQQEMDSHSWVGHDCLCRRKRPGTNEICAGCIPGKLRQKCYIFQHRTRAWPLCPFIKEFIANGFGGIDRCADSILFVDEKETGEEDCNPASTLSFAIPPTFEEDCEYWYMKYVCMRQGRRPKDKVLPLLDLSAAAEKCVEASSVFITHEVVDPRHTFHIPERFCPCEPFPTPTPTNYPWVQGDNIFPPLSRTFANSIQKLMEEGSSIERTLNVILTGDQRHAKLISFLRDQHEIFKKIDVVIAGKTKKAFQIPAYKEFLEKLQHQEIIRNAIPRQTAGSPSATGANDYVESAGSGSTKSIMDSLCTISKSKTLQVQKFTLLGTLAADELNLKTRLIKGGWHIYAFGPGSATCPSCLDGDVDNQQRTRERHLHCYVSLYLVPSRLYVACNLPSCRKVYELKTVWESKYISWMADMGFQKPATDHIQFQAIRDAHQPILNWAKRLNRNARVIDPLYHASVDLQQDMDRHRQRQVDDALLHMQRIAPHACQQVETDVISNIEEADEVDEDESMEVDELDPFADDANETL